MYYICYNEYLYIYAYIIGERGLSNRLRNVVENDFARITYTEAVSLLQQHVEEGKVLHKIVTKEEKKSKGIYITDLYNLKNCRNLIKKFK